MSAGSELVQPKLVLGDVEPVPIRSLLSVNSAKRLPYIVVAVIVSR